MFRYRKLYADVVTQDGSVCVGYVSWLSFWGYELRSAGFEWYPSAGQRRVERAQGPAEVQHAGGEVRLRFTTMSGPFTLALQGAALEREAAPLTPHLTWRVLTTNARAAARGLGGTADVEGTGYADLVEMTRPPRALGLASIEWGRGHVADESFVFTQACFRDGRVFRSALSDGVPSNLLELQREGFADLDVRVGGSSITLQNQRVLHSGSALDAARFPVRAERVLARLCSGRVRETRWLARATFSSGASTLALHEKVLLG